MQKVFVVCKKGSQLTFAASSFPYKMTENLAICVVAQICLEILQNNALCNTRALQQQQQKLSE
jgi:hypothetical protein